MFCQGRDQAEQGLCLVYCGAEKEEGDKRVDPLETGAAYKPG